MNKRCHLLLGIALGLSGSIFLKGQQKPPVVGITAAEIDRVLKYTGFNQQRAALLLGIARRTLRQKLQELGLHVTHCVQAN